MNTTLTPHSIIHGDACFAYFNKIWGIPPFNLTAPIVVSIAAFLVERSLSVKRSIQWHSSAAAHVP
ncbi:MAG TPA: hypothetical protein VF760_10355, partial [Xanthobacteraceae bacterium]